MAVIIPTNAVEIARFANGLFGLQLGFATSNQVAGDVSAYGGLNAAFNNYYTLAYGSATTASVAAAMAANLGITAANGVADADITSATAYITAQLNAAPASARGAVVKSVLDMWSNIASDPVNGPKYGTAATAWNNQIASAVTYAGAINPDITVAAAATAGSTFALTTGVDNFTGTSGTDTINAILGTGATLNSFDVIAGGVGTDTLNLIDDTAGAFAMPTSVTFSGLENVNLSRSGATGADTVTVTNTTFGSGVKKFSVVNAGANTTGAASVTLASAESISVVSTGTAFTTVTAIDTDGTSTTTEGSTLKTVSITKNTGAGTVKGNGVNTLNLNAAATGDTVTVTAAAGDRALTINTSGSTSSGAVTDAEATAVTLNETSAAGIGIITTAKAKSVTINTTGTSTTTGAETITAALATSVSFGGTRANALTVGDLSAVTSITVAGSGGVTLGDLSGLATLTSVDTTGSTAVASTTGAANVTVANTVQVGNTVSFTGGAGSDTVTVGATTKAIALGAGDDQAIVSVTALGTGGSISGGDGIDTLKLSQGDAVTLSSSNAGTTAFKAAVTGFEVLDIGTQANGTVKVNSLADFTKLKLVGADADMTLSGVTTGLSIEVTAGADSTHTLTTNTITGANDTLNLALKGDLSAGVEVFGVFATPGVENVNIAMVDTNATFTAHAATAELTDADVKSIVVTGNNSLTLTYTGTSLTNFDASGLTKGAVSFTPGALTTDSVAKGSVTGGDTLDFHNAVAKVTITSTAGTNTLKGSSTVASTITGGSGNDTITGGSGGDTIVVGAGATANTVTGAAGADKIDLTGSTGVNTLIFGVASTSVSATGANVDTITNFKSGVDKIQLTAGVNSASATTVSAGGLAGINLANNSTLATMGAVITNATSVATIADVYTALADDLNNVGSHAFAASATGASHIVAREVTYTTGAAAGTYLVINDVTAGFQAATDVVIKLVGTTAITVGDIVVV